MSEKIEERRAIVLDIKSIRRKIIAGVLTVSVVCGTLFSGFSLNVRASSTMPTFNNTGGFTAAAAPTSDYVEQTVGLPDNKTAILTWISTSNSYFLHTYDAYGNLIKTTNLTNLMVTRYNAQYCSICALSSGNILVSYYAGSVNPSESVIYNAFFMVVDQSGNVVVSQTQINSYSSGTSLTRFVSMAQLTNGNIAFSYQLNDNVRIATRVFHSDGSPVTEETIYNTTNASSSYVTAGNDGGYLVEFSDYFSSTYHHYYQIFHSSGAIYTATAQTEISVPANSQYSAFVATLPCGNYMVEIGGTYPSAQYTANLFDANGNSVGTKSMDFMLDSSSFAVYRDSSGCEGFVTASYDPAYLTAMNNGTNWTSPVSLYLTYYDDSCNKVGTTTSAVDSGYAYMQWNESEYTYDPNICPSFYLFSGYGGGLGIVKKADTVGDYTKGESDAITVKLFNMRIIAYTVSFHANNGTGSMSDENFYDTAQSLTANKFTRLGYTFLGWSTDPDAMTATYTDSQSVSGLGTSGATVNLYAVWSANSYTVRFNANNGSGTMGDEGFVYGTAKNLSANTFTRAGYTFLGWSTDASATTAAYADGESVNNLASTANETTNFYAVWSPNSYSVQFHANGGSGTMDDQNFVYGTAKALTANAFTRTGYIFLGWSTNPDATTATYTNNQSVSNLTGTANGAADLYAVWAGNPYTVHFEANGGSGTMSDESYIYGASKALSGNSFALTGYTFLGWSTDPSATAATYSNGQSVSNLTSAANGTVTLYAVWTVNNYTVQFHANGGSGTMNDQSFVYGTAKALTANAFTRTGYNFLGWSTNPDATTATYTNNQSVSNLTGTANGAVNLYAVWAGNPYTVHFDANGGSGTMSDESYTYGASKALSGNSFALTGYTFLGWSTDPSATAATYSNGQSVSNLTSAANGTVTLYAVWASNGYTVQFHANGGTGTMNSEGFSYGAAKALTANIFTRTGNTFLGWSTDPDATTATYTNNQSVSNLTDTVNGTVDLYAVWMVNSYKVHFDANSGLGTMSDEDFAYGTAKNLTANVFPRAGYTFLGWSANPDAAAATYSNGQSVSNLTSAANGMVTLYAVWSANSYTVTVQNGSGSGSYATDSTVSITANAAPQGKIFDHWNASGVTLTNPNSASTAFTMPAGTVTVTAIYKDASVAPTITSQPHSQTAVGNQSVTFSIAASGSQPFYYQWYKDGKAITRATGNTFTITAAQSSDEGVYTVKVSNSVGTVTSEEFVLTVNFGSADGDIQKHVTASGDTPSQVDIKSDDINEIGSNNVGVSVGNVQISIPAAVVNGLTSDTLNSYLRLTQAATSVGTVSTIQTLATASNTIVTSLDVNLTRYLSNGTSEAVHQLGGYIKVTIDLTGTQLALITNPKTAQMLYYNPNTQTLEPVQATFDLNSKTVTFYINHLSTFVVVQGKSSSSSTSSTVSNPQTGSPALPYGIMLVNTLACLTAAAMLYRRRKDQKRNRQ